MPEKFIVDRIEGDFAVCESEGSGMLNIPLSVLPADIKEGSYIIKDGENFFIDLCGEETARTRIREKMDRIFKKR